MGERMDQRRLDAALRRIAEVSRRTQALSPAARATAAEALAQLSVRLAEPCCGAEPSRERGGGKRGAAAVLQSRERFLAFMNRLPACAFIKDPKGRLLFANPHLVELFGWRSWRGKTAVDLLPPETAARMRADDRAVLAGRELTVAERVVDRHGVERLFETRKFPIPVEGRLPLLGGISLDITEKARHEEALRASEAKYRGLYDRMMDGFVRVTRDGRFVECNEAFEALTGYTEEELRSLTYMEITPFGWHAMEAEVVEERILKTGDSGIYEKEYRRKDGTLVPVEIRGAVDRDAEGRPTHFWGIVRDISSRKAAEEALRAAAADWRSTFDNLADPILLLDPEQTVVKCNRAFASLVGLPFREIVGRKCYEVMHQTLASAAGCPFARMRDSGRREIGELAVRDRVFQVVTDPILEKEQLRGTVHVMRDVTERRRDEEAARARQRAEALHTAVLKVFLGFSGTEMYRELLRVALDCVRSPDGFFGHLDKRGFLTCVTLSAGAGGEAASRAEPVVVPASGATGLWGRTLREGRSLFKNGSMAPPAGHRELRRALCTPISYGGEILGLFVAANREKAYEESDCASLEELAVFVAPVLAARLQRDAEELGRRAAERALRESQQTFATFMNHLPACVFIRDREGRQIYANPYLQELFGWREWRGKTVHELLPPPARERMLEDDSRVLELGPMVFEERVRDARGEERIMETRKFPVAVEGSPALLGGIAIDVTERVAAEQARREQDARFRALFENALIGLYQIAPGGEVLMANRALCGMLGYDSLEELRRSYAERGGFRLGYSRVCFEKEIGERGQIVGLETRWARRDGSAIAVRENSRTVLGERGELLYYEGTVEDITERRRVEAELQEYRDRLQELVQSRTAELEFTMRELESFTYSVSHDLRAPLRAMDGFARILLEDYGERMDGEAKRLIGVICANTRRMGLLIEDLLSLSRVGRKELDSRPVDMTSLAGAVLEEVRKGVPGWPGRVVLGDLPGASGDPVLLRQVWENLFSNALKFTARAQDPCVEVTGRIEGEEAIYTVQDNGAGFDPRLAGKLFGVFQRLHGAEEFEGNGVGLAILQRIVVRHHGRVCAEGRPDEGAAFHFALPRPA